MLLGKSTLNEGHKNGFLSFKTVLLGKDSGSTKSLRRFRKSPRFQGFQEALSDVFCVMKVLLRAAASNENGKFLVENLLDKYEDIDNNRGIDACFGDFLCSVMTTMGIFGKNESGFSEKIRVLLMGRKSALWDDVGLYFPHLKEIYQGEIKKFIE